MSLPSLSVIVVTHNHAAYLPRCLNALIPEVKRVEGEVIVIDNCSSDASATIAADYPDVRLHINRQQRGFAANCNYGMALAERHYLLLLNPDTEVLPQALDNLIAFMDAHPTAGLCGAQLLFPDGQVQPSMRRFPTLGSFVTRRTPLRVFMQNSSFNRRHLMLDQSYLEAQEVDWLLGACLFVRRETLEQVGPLDEGYWLYVEDIDWARRIHQAGWKVYYVPSAKIIHHHLAVSDKHFFSRRMWIHMRSIVRYCRKFLLPPLPWLSISDNKLDVWRNAHQHLPQ